MSTTIQNENIAQTRRITLIGMIINIGLSGIAEQGPDVGDVIVHLEPFSEPKNGG